MQEAIAANTQLIQRNALFEEVAFVDPRHLVAQGLKREPGLESMLDAASVRCLALRAEMWFHSVSGHTPPPTRT